jgi:hypothetical protein
MYAQLLREAYLSGIWDLPLALPLNGIEAPDVFMPNRTSIPNFTPPRCLEGQPAELTDTCSKTSPTLSGLVKAMLAIR